jgi:hypothetical protein
MSKDKDVSEPIGGPPAPRRPGTPAMMQAINGLLVSIGTLYLVTNSVVVAAIGAVLVIILMVLWLMLYR